MNLDKKFIIKRPFEFKLDHIFECGQAFRWKKEDDGSYSLIAFSRVLNVLEKDKELIFRNTDEKDFNNIWKEYFDLSRDYSLIRESLNINDLMKKIIDFGYGIRILKQDIFETIITFIISANNQIPRIMKSVNLLSKYYGDNIEGEYYSFPKASVLAGRKRDDIRELTRVGFRDQRIIDTSRMIADGFLEDNIKDSMTSDEIEEVLQRLPGVGPKVASCISLFAFNRGDSFPVDVWIKRTMEELFFGKELKKKDIKKYARDLFGEYCGYGQQYIFFYGRENKVGK